MASLGIIASISILIIRLMIGLSFMGHGAQKLFGWFGGGGIKGTANLFESIGVKPSAVMAVMAGLLEFGGGALLALGFLTLSVPGKHFLMQHRKRLMLEGFYEKYKQTYFGIWSNWKTGGRRSSQIVRRWMDGACCLP